MTIKFLRPLFVSPVCIFIIICFLFLSRSSASVDNNNPFEMNPKLRDYAQKALQAVQSKDPAYLEVPQLDEKEMEDVYRHLRGNLNNPQPLNIWELVLLDYPRLRLLRNEIYARHGRIFSSEDLDKYFQSFSWYKPTNNFSESKLSILEQGNASIITRLEYLKFHGHEQFVKKLKVFKQEDGRTKYVSEVNADVSVRFDGCCGSTWGSTRIQDKQGNVRFSSSFGYDGGAGTMEYLFPLWGKNLIAWISGEVEEGKYHNDGSPMTHDRIAVLNSNGSPIVDLKLADADHRFFLSQGTDLRQVVLITPDVLYSLASGGEKNRQSLVFTKKAIPFHPQIGSLYKWSPFELSSIESDCKKQTQNDHIAPVYNPTALWEKEFFFSELPPVISQQYVIFFVPHHELPDMYIASTTRNNEVNFDIIMINKLNGKQPWSYTVPARIESHHLKDNLLSIKYYQGLALIDVSTGKEIWNIKVEPAYYQFPYKTELLIGDSTLLLGSKSLNYDIYNLKTGALVMRRNIQKEFIKLSFPTYPADEKQILRLNDLLILLFFAEIEQSTGERIQSHIVIAIDAKGDIQWQYTLTQKKDAQIFGLWLLQKNCNIVIQDSQKMIFVSLDPATGKQIDTRLIDQASSPQMSWYLTDIYRSEENDGDETKEIKEAKIKKKPEAKAVKKAETKAVWPCVSTPLIGRVVYAWDSYWSSRTINLLDACVTEDKNEDKRAYRKVYWSFAPWQKDRYGENLQKIIFIDNNFILVEVANKPSAIKKRYWAVGEEALRDYSLRKGGYIYDNTQKEIQIKK